MNEETIQRLAREVYQAEINMKPIPPFTENGYSDMTMEEAYKIQLAAIDLKIADGQKVVGKKIGLTNKAVQKARGISEPDYGHIMDVRVGNQDEPYKMSDLMVAPAIECELAFILKEDIMGPGVTAANVINATLGVVPAFEIVERRFYPLCKDVKDSICDNAAFGHIILGDKVTPIINLDFRTLGLVVEKNGIPIDMSAGAAVLGNPVESVVWLANKLSEYGVGLKKGELILSGSVGLMHTASAGECYYAHFGNSIGSVKVVFVE